MGLLKDSYNTGTYERKTSAERSRRNPGMLKDSHNPKADITTPVAPIPTAKTSATGTAKYTK